MGTEMDENELAGAIAAGAAVVQGWGNLLAAAEEVMGPDNPSVGSGWIDGAEESSKNKRRRAVYERPSCGESVFGKMLANEAALLDPATREAKQFRVRCRLPYQVFKEVMKCARKGKWFLEVQADVAGRRTISPEVKVMASLYVLGRACGYGNVGMLSGMSETAVRDSLITFCKKVVDDLHHVHVRLPEGDDLKDVMKRYSRKGFPGAIGAIDVTHVLWDRVPAAEATDHAGKEGKPTLAFQVIVDFTRRVLANTDGFAGAENDMTISRHDEAIGIIRTQQPYTTQAFELYDANGNKQTRHGAYLLCDGGYLKWPIMQCPMKTPGTVEAQQFSKQLDSVRKDVECFFGIVKGRFRFLKSALLYRDKGFINNAFSTCCVLHNILHAWDGLGRLEDEDWAGVDGEPEDGSLDYPNGLGHGGVGGNEDGASEEDQAGFYKLRDELVINFAQMKARKQIKF